MSYIRFFYYEKPHIGLKPAFNIRWWHIAGFKATGLTLSHRTRVHKTCAWTWSKKVSNRCLFILPLFALLYSLHLLSMHNLIHCHLLKMSPKKKKHVITVTLWRKKMSNIPHWNHLRLWKSKIVRVGRWPPKFLCPVLETSNKSALSKTYLYHVKPKISIFFLCPKSILVWDFVQQMTILSNCKLLIHVIKHELCLLIMKQVTAVWLQNGLKCTV